MFNKLSVLTKERDDAAWDVLVKTTAVENMGVEIARLVKLQKKFKADIVTSSELLTKKEAEIFNLFDEHNKSNKIK